jgi:hypothetical protein
MTQVNFSARRNTNTNTVLSDASPIRIRADATGNDPGIRCEHIRSDRYLHGRHEAASRNDLGRLAPFDQYLPKSFGVGR